MLLHSIIEEIILKYLSEWRFQGLLIVFAKKRPQNGRELGLKLGKLSVTKSFIA